MNSDKLGTLTGTGEYRRVEVKRTLNAPIEKVWSALTNSKELELWAGPCEIDPREGGRMKSGDMECEGDGHAQDGTIKVFQPPHVLEYTWSDAHAEGGLVRYDLVALDANTTEITLVNTLNSTDFIAAAAGWHEMLERLSQTLDTGEAITDSTERGKELYAIYQNALG